jgi:RimJ/RimL family protein N-acetyltransferase
VIETDRLALRPLSSDDLDAWADFLGDAGATRLTHLPGPVDRELAAKLLARWIAKAEGPVAMYAAVVRESGETAGFVGYVPRQLDWGDELELGWLLRRAFHGLGYATEAARALRPLVPGRVISLIRVENEPSKNVARKLGMEVEREVEVAGYATDVFVSPRPRPSSRARPRRRGSRP